MLFWLPGPALTNKHGANHPSKMICWEITHRATPKANAALTGIQRRSQMIHGEKTGLRVPPSATHGNGTAGSGSCQGDTSGKPGVTPVGK